MEDPAEVSTVDLEPDVESASYQGSAKTGNLISNAARDEEKLFLGQTKSQLKLLMYLGIGYVVLCGFFGLMGGLFWTMSWQGWVSLYIMLTAVLLLIADKWDSSLTFVGVLIMLLLCRIVTLQEALEGFGNSAVATIAVLCIVAAAVEECSVMDILVNRVLRHPKNTYTALLRFVPVVIVLSAFTNNTPIVLIFIRVLQSWSIRINLPLSRLLMPLSFASILGGTCTIIGTSTNLVVQGLAGDTVDLGFFEVGIIGVPLAVLGTVYMVVAAKFLLPERTERSEYMPVSSCWHMVNEEGGLVGKTSEQAGFFAYPGATLICVKRSSSQHEEGADVLMAVAYRDVAKEEPLESGDLCFFVGIDECITELAGLVRCTEDKHVSAVVFECEISRGQVEITVTDFEQHFECRVVSVTRDGKVILAGAIETLQRRDVVILESTYAFLHHSTAAQFTKIRHVEPLLIKKQTGILSKLHPIIVTVLVVAMVVLAVFDFVALFTLAGVISILFVALRIITWNQAMDSIPGKMLALISSSFALALALERTGVAANIAKGLSFIFKPGGTYTQLMGIYIATTLLTSFVSNAAAASVMYPIIIGVVNDTGLSLKAALYTLMISASFAFMTPIGYQTNLMVEAAGGYSWGDFARFGGPLTLLCAVVTPGIAMLAWPAVPLNSTVV